MRLGRHRDDKQAVGFFWAIDEDELIVLVDQCSDVRDCEFQEIVSGGGFGWDTPCPGIGVKRDWERSQQNFSPAVKELADLRRLIEPFGSVETFFFDDQSEDDWTPLELIDKPPKPRPKPRTAKEIIQAVKDDTQSSYGKVTVYFIGSGDYIKIGITAGSAHGRMRSLATAHYAEMTVLATIRDAMPALEEELHQRFSQYRAKGEWFRAAPELLAFIEELKASKS